MSSSPLEGVFYFLGPTTVNITPPAPTQPSLDPETVFWQSIALSNNAADFDEYLRQYPQGRFAGLAHNRLAVLRSLLLAGSALAQTPAPAASPAPAAAPATPAATTKSGKLHSAASIECSKEADAKGLHGKERKKFRSECRKEAKEGAAAPASK